MIKFLIIGDSHIPQRAKQIPSKIKEKIDALTKIENVDYTFFTGDLIKAPEFIDFLKIKTKKEVFLVIGNMDYYGGNRDAPIYQELNIKLNEMETIKIGLTHGAQIEPRGDRTQLESLALERNYNILISGHTHKEDIFLTNKGILLINPGSATGAWSFIASGIPSFMVLSVDIENKEIKIQLFQLNQKNNEISEYSYNFIIKNNRIYSKF